MGLNEMIEADERAQEVPGAVPQRYESPADGGAVPDVETSGTRPADRSTSVHEAWRRVMRDVEWIGKRRQTTSGAKYSYRGIDDVMNVVGPALRKHGVSVIPTGIEPTFEVIATSGGSKMNYARCTVTFTIYGPNDDSFTASVLGEGFDSGDKSGSKAQSIALRTFLVNALAIQTNEPSRDTEYGRQYELAGVVKPTPEAYAAEILDENTTLRRLSQIKQEFINDKPTGVKEIELAGGEKIRLIDLVQREGVRKAKGESAQ